MVSDGRVGKAYAINDIIEGKYFYPLGQSVIPSAHLAHCIWSDSGSREVLKLYG